MDVVLVRGDCGSWQGAAWACFVVDAEPDQHVLADDKMGGGGWSKKTGRDSLVTGREELDLHKRQAIPPSLLNGTCG